MARKPKYIPHSEKNFSNVITCKNCETQFSGKYCPNCGQSVHHLEQPFKFLVVDFLGNLFAFDTRFWKTFIALLVYPAKYTEDYLNGKRARYMPPFQFYVFISFVFFLLLSTYLNKKIQITEKAKNEISTSLNEQYLSDSIVTDTTKNYNITIGLDEENDKKLAQTILFVMDNPGIYMNSFLKYFSWSLFLLMPIYAFYLWVFYHKRKKYYFSHLIFTINQHAFIFLLFALIISIKLIFPARDYFPENYLFWILPVYLYMGQLMFYKRSWYGTFFRFVTSLFIYIFTLSMSLSIILLVWIKSEFL